VELIADPALEAPPADPAAARALRMDQLDDQAEFGSISSAFESVVAAHLQAAEPRREGAEPRLEDAEPESAATAEVPNALLLAASRLRAMQRGESVVQRPSIDAVAFAEPVTAPADLEPAPAVASGEPVEPLEPLKPLDPLLAAAARLKSLRRN